MSRAQVTHDTEAWIGSLEGWRTGIHISDLGQLRKKSLFIRHASCVTLNLPMLLPFYEKSKQLGSCILKLLSEEV